MNPVDDPESYHRITGSEDWFTDLYLVDREGEYNDDEFPFKLEDWSGGQEGPNSTMRIHRNEVRPLIETLAHLNDEVPSHAASFLLGAFLGAAAAGLET